MTKTLEPAAETLYREIVAHYGSCRVEKRYLSDTWDHTLNQKGRLFPLATMQSMLALGNRVNTWIDDSNHLADRTILDPSDRIAAKLVAFGENDFGEPRRDLLLGGRYYSTNFVHHVFYASKIIRALEAGGVERPRILEIGGGLAGVAYLLRRYYGERLTYFAADLPETLFIQEFYLRSSFPDAAATFKGAEPRVEPAAGGLNFVNAYTLSSQDYAIDAAINIDSMQEMNSEAVSLYVDYIQRNLAPNGFFFFQNHYGHAAQSFSEPTEYPLDGFWRVESVELSPDLEGCGCEQARLLCRRVETPEDPAARRLALRTLWNGLLSGRLSNDAALVSALMALPSRVKEAEAPPAIAEVLGRHGATIPDAWLQALRQSPYFPAEAFAGRADGGLPRTAAGAPFTQRMANALWRLQWGFLGALEDAADGRADAASSKEALRRLCASERAAVDEAAASEFWSGYFASLFLAVGETELGAGLLRRAGELTGNPFWLTRFAYLWQRFGFAAEAAALLKKIGALQPSDYFVNLKRAELEAAAGNAAGARRLLDAAKSGAGADPARWTCLAKTAARIGDSSSAWEATTTAAAEDAGALARIALDVLAASPDQALDGRASELLAQVGADAGADAAIIRTSLLLRAGRRAEGVERLAALEQRFADDYFSLGRLGKLAQQAGLDALADRCFQKSLAFRPGAFLHLDFVGNAYFGAGRYADAAKAYGEALALKPYLKHLRAKHSYCRLPEALRSSGVFGKPSDLRLIFQREHDFYHDLGPASK